MIESERKARVKKSTSLHLAMESTETLRQINEFPVIPEGMTYFYDLCKSQFANGMNFPKNGRKLRNSPLTGAGTGIDSGLR